MGQWLIPLDMESCVLTRYEVTMGQWLIPLDMESCVFTRYEVTMGQWLIPLNKEGNESLTHRYFISS
jgi:hypothetical protein